MFTRLLTVLLAVVAACLPLEVAAQQVNGNITGRILETSAGLPVANAKIDLRQSGRNVASTTTSGTGSFTLSNVPPGDYTLTVSAARYQTVSTPVTVAYSSTTQFQTALSPAATGLREIAAVQTGGRSSLQTTSTINASLPATVVIDQNYVRAGDALATLPFVTRSTSSSMGDDESLSLRGFDPTEGATLIDGHPVGPIGAHGTAYDYQLAQFWGFTNSQIIYGSGATGLYAVPVLSGAVNFETLNPTSQPHTTLTQGYGDFSKTLSAGSFTGTIGRLGYAGAYGVQGTDGMLGPAPIFQSGLLNAGQSRCPGSPTATTYVGLINANPNFNGGAIPPSITAADKAACTYNVSGQYLSRNALGKFTYQLGPRTSVLATVYNATIWADSTGNGDTDFIPYQYQLAVANQSVASGPVNFTLPNGSTTGCTGSTIAALSDTSAGYSCLTPAQDAQAFSGPQGGGLERYHAAQNQDYHARITQGIGPGNVILDGFIDNYHFVNQKGPINFVLQAPSFLDDYFTHGGVIGYEWSGKRNDVSVGVDFLHQLYLNNRAVSPAFGPYNQSATITETSYYVHDAWTPSGKWSIFSDLSIERSVNTATTNADPRISIMYRPTSSDVVRAAWGRATSEPDPSLLLGGFSFVAPYASNPSFNPQQNCGNNLVSLASGASPFVKPEQANDVELALAHRFQNSATLEFDGYITTENNPILTAVYPLSIVPAGQVPAASYFTGYASALAQVCGHPFTQANFGVTAPYNAGQAVYRGFNLQTRVPIIRGLEIDGNYAVQSAYYNGLNTDVLVNNTGLINQAQITGVPLQTANAGIGYASNPGAWTARFDEHFVAGNNGFNRPAYWFATANASKTVGPITFNLGVFNVFNQNTLQYGLIGLGTPLPFNQFGSPSSLSYNNNFEEYFLGTRQYFLTTTYHF